MDGALRGKLDALASKLKGQRYGSVGSEISMIAEGDERIADVWTWLRAEMDS